MDSPDTRVKHQILYKNKGDIYFGRARRRPKEDGKVMQGERSVLVCLPHESEWFLWHDDCAEDAGVYDF